MGVSMTKYYINSEGNYLGGFDGAEPPDGSIEVLTAPDNGLDKWSGKEWIAYKYVPSIVSMRQARLALLQAGLLSTVNAAISAGGDADKIEWEYAADVDRNSPLVHNMKAGLNLTDADLDSLFTLASSL